MAQKQKGKKSKRTLKGWTQDELKQFRQLLKDGFPTDRIAKALKRTAASVRSKAQKLSLSLGGGRGGNRKRAARASR